MNTEIIAAKELEPFQFISKSNYASFFVRKDLAILLVVYQPKTEITLELAKKIVETTYEIIQKHQLQYIISDNRAVSISSTSEAREYLSDNKTLRLVSANAILVKELSVRILVNFFIRVNKPIVPFRNCKSIENALSWFKRLENH